MNCHQARRDMLDLFEGGEHEAALRNHLRTCAGCRAEYEETARVLASLEPGDPVRATAGFKERVMNRLTHEIEAAQTAAQPRRTAWSAAFRFALAGAAALALILGLPYLSGIGKRGAPPAVTALLAQSVDSLANLRSVHISARMRTLPHDNFDMIGLKYDFVPVEIWRDFSNPPRWRFEKPGRTVVMDGASSLLFMHPDQAMRGGPDANFVEWLKPLLEPQQLLERELRVAHKEKIAASLAEEQSGGARVAVLRMAPKAQGDFTNDWTRNKSIPESDHTRVYRFDVATKRLTGLQVVVDKTVVFETTSIQYNEALAASLFTVELPANVAWIVPAEQMPTKRPLPATARETAVRFLESLAAKDWEGVESVDSPVTERLQKYAGGLTVTAIGEPFQSGLYRGWFVPYEVRLAGGHIKKHNLAVRNDNKAQRWYVDGGF